MRYLLTIITIMALAQTAKAKTWKYMPESMALVKENLNKDLYTHDDLIVNFSLSMNHEVAHLQIYESICPTIQGDISCLAMPSVLLNAAYTLKHVKTDPCGVQTFVSNSVEVGSPFTRSQRRFAQIRVKDFSNSVCEMIYTSDVEVDLKDTMSNTDLNKIEIHYSTLAFSYLREGGPVDQ